MRNELAQREVLLREAADGFASAGDLWGQALTLLLFGEMRAVDGADPSTARVAFEQTIEIARTLGVASVEGIALARLGNVAVQEGDNLLAARLHDEALVIGRRLAYPPVLAFTLNSIALRLRREGRLDEAMIAAAEAFELYRRGSSDGGPDDKVHLDAPEGAAMSLHLLGLIAADQDDTDQAQELLTRALQAAQRTSDPLLLAITLEGLAFVAALAGRADETAGLLGHAAALRETCGTGYSTFVDDTDRARELALAQLGDDAFTVAFEQGHGSELGESMSFSAYL
jgi:tetratricopeptide (TPR) repeat protein